MQEHRIQISGENKSSLVVGHLMQDKTQLSTNLVYI